MTRSDEQTLGWICGLTGATAAEPVQRIQSLWSGYGEIQRIRLRGCATPSAVLKRVEPPTEARHPRGWNTSRSHQRKLHSYEVELAFYRDHARHCRASARVPECYGSSSGDGRWMFLLEDLDASGFAGRRMDLAAAELDACLIWLAGLHATFLGCEPAGLWSVGTYWHLATRPDELEAVGDPRLRAAAPILDARLNACEFQTLVHGDAKVANFCFAEDRPAVAAVDFQYVGGGCGIKDVAYFLSSCMSDVECEQQAPRHLDTYFAALRRALAELQQPVDAAALEAEWRALYPIAWADFYRFLAGWSPDHWKIHGYSDRLTREVLDQLL